MTSQRPAVVCHALLAALDASEGRRRRRKRDTTPDAVGMTIERQLLSQAVMDVPDPEMFEAWLARRCLAGADSASMGAMRAGERDPGRMGARQNVGRLLGLARA